MIYLDTSAMVKLVIREQESAELIEWLNSATGDAYAHALGAAVRSDCCTAQLGHIELMRAALRIADVAEPEPPGHDDVVAAARRLLDKIDTLQMSPDILELAKTIPPTEMRTLDAIHLATILENRSSVTSVCAYDRRLISACEQHNLEVFSPGAPHQP